MIEKNKEINSCDIAKHQIFHIFIAIDFNPHFSLNFYFPMRFPVELFQNPSLKYYVIGLKKFLD